MYNEATDTYGPPTPARNFTGLAQDAADLLMALRRLQQDRPSAKALLDAALKAAEIEIEQLLTIESRINHPTIDPGIERFVRRLSKLVIDGLITEVPIRKFPKLVTAYGDQSTAVQLAAEQISIAQCFALAVQRAIRLKPEAFGQLEDIEDRQHKLAEYRQLLDLHYAAMRQAYTPTDLLIGGERAAGDAPVPRGYVKISFKLAPHITPDDLDWPRLLTEHLLATAAVPEAEPPKIKRKVVLPVKEVTRRKARSDTLQPAEEAPA